MSQILFSELIDIEKISTDGLQFVAKSDLPSLKVSKDFKRGKSYLMAGSFFYAEGCFPQPTLKIFNPNTGKTRYSAFFHNSYKNHIELIFTPEEDGEIVYFIPYFQKGKFEIKSLRISEVSGLVLYYYNTKKSLRPYLSFIQSRIHFALLFFKLFFTEGPRRAVGRVLDRVRSRYGLWILFFDSNGSLKKKETQRIYASLKFAPKVSIVMPVYNVEKGYLIEAIESVRRQVYQNWELCIADDCSTRPYIREVLTQMMALDSRIKVIFREKNGHISEASNSALEIATGDFIALMDHDDVMVDSALVWVAHAIEKNSNCALIYSDEDKINEKGYRFSPFFKPDWSPELFLSMNILTHLNVFKADIVRKIGGFRKGYEGSQDYDFCLRFLDHIKADQVVHIPKVLYHWRAIEGSVALDSREKQYAHDAARKAILEYHQRQGVDVKVVSGFGPLHRVLYSYKNEDNKVSVIICTRDAKNILKVCIDSIIQKTTFPNYEIIVVDNGSIEPATFAYFDELKKRDFIKVVRIDCPFNYSFLNNEGAKYASGNLLCFLNNDIEVITPGWLEELVMHAQRKDIGAVGAKLYYPNGLIQHFGIVTGIMGGVAGHAFKYFSGNADGYFGRLRVVNNVSAVTGACLMTRKDVFESVGGFDDVNLAVAYNDVDLCLKILAKNLRIVVTPFAELTHHESLTRGHEDTPEKKARLKKEQDFMKKRWGKSLTDRYYNPNLTLVHENYSLAWPPANEEI